MLLKIAVAAVLFCALAAGAVSAADPAPSERTVEVPVVLGNGGSFLVDPSTGRIPVAAALTGLIPLPGAGHFRLDRLGLFHWTGTLPTGGAGCPARVLGVVGALDQRVVTSRGRISILGTRIHPLAAGRAQVAFVGAESLPVSARWFVIRASMVRRHPLAAVAVMRLPAGVAPELSQRYLYFSEQAHSRCNRTHPAALIRYLRGVAPRFGAKVGG